MNTHRYRGKIGDRKIFAGWVDKLMGDDNGLINGKRITEAALEFCQEHQCTPDGRDCWMSD